jgi:thioredoxin 1
VEFVKAMMELKLALWLTSILCILFAIAVSGPGMETSGIKINNSSSSPILEFPDSPILVNDSTLDSCLKKYSPFILDCWEPGCNPCQLIDPKIDQMARDFQGQVVFGKLNIKQNIEIMVQYRVFNYPTLLIFKNGSMIYRHIGNCPIATLEEIISNKLGIKKACNQIEGLFLNPPKSSHY